MNIQTMLRQHMKSHNVEGTLLAEDIGEGADRIDYLEDRAERLEQALLAARRQLVTLGGDRLKPSDDAYGDAIHEAVLTTVDQAIEA